MDGEKSYYFCKVKLREDEESKPRTCEILAYGYSPTDAEKQVNEYFRYSISEFYIEQITKKKIEAVIGDEDVRNTKDSPEPETENDLNI